MNPSDLLCGRRVRLTALTAEDLPQIAAWRRNPDLLRLYDALPAYPQTVAQLESWLDERHKANNAYLFAVRRRESEDLLGHLELEDILWVHQVGWLSIAIGDPAHWGQGYGTEAAELALGFAFRELNLHRVQLTVFSYNERAIALYERLGFRREGVFREFLQRDGRRYDMFLYGLLRDEWAGHS